VHSQRVMLALTQKGASREEAYRLVQRNAMPVWRGGGDFRALLAKDRDVRRYLSKAEIAAEFDLDFHLKHVDMIFKRVFGVDHASSQRAARVGQRRRQAPAAARDRLE
jgi:adenylosuccinate lyase